MNAYEIGWNLKSVIIMETTYRIDNDRFETANSARPMKENQENYCFNARLQS